MQQDEWKSRIFRELPAGKDVLSYANHDENLGMRMMWDETENIG